MHSYLAYGIGFHSVLPLPELVSGKVRADVEIRLGPLDASAIDFGDKYYRCWRSEEGTFLYWKDVATFLVREGREIVIDPVLGVEEKRLRLILLGAVISIVLQQRGYMVFHASALAIRGSAAIFIGNKGWGKSTIAAALHNRGHSFLADDVVAIEDRIGDTYTIAPAFPQIKLWSDAIFSMGNDPSMFPTVSSLVDKRDYRLSNGFVHGSVPLKCIYVLGVSDNTGPEISALTPQESLIYLIAQTYNARWGKEMFAEDSGSHLVRCNAIVKKIPIYHLKRPRSLELLDITAEMVEGHLLGTETN